MRVRNVGYTQKLQMRYNKDIQDYDKVKGEKYAVKRYIVYFIQNKRE